MTALPAAVSFFIGGWSWFPVWLKEKLATLSDIITVLYIVQRAELWEGITAPTHSRKGKRPDQSTACSEKAAVTGPAQVSPCISTQMWKKCTNYEYCTTN